MAKAINRGGRPREGYTKFTIILSDRHIRALVMMGERRGWNKADSIRYAIEQVIRREKVLDEE